MGDPYFALVVEADPTTRDQLAAALEGAGAQVTTAGTVSVAVTSLMDTRVDLIVVSLELPTESGLSVVQHARQSGDEVVVVMVAHTSDVQARVDAFAAGVDDFLLKPVSAAELVARSDRHRARAGTVRRLQADNARLLELSTTDGLTQIANHRAFQDRLRDEFRRAQRYDDPLALILIDLDHFKRVNDQYGHQAGDEVLRGFSGVLREAVRETDFVARYGGEEFAVLLPKTHLAGALTVAERICSGLKALRVGPWAIRVTASFGVSSFPGRQVNTSEQLVKTADDALFRSKHEGRDKISLYQTAGLAQANP
jgi:diguanylate cyclase (GGDEF)-like protein